MRKILAFLISFLFFVFSLTFSGQAFYPQDVIINEIAWMGTEISYNNEWIELYNNTNETINLDGWVLKASDGTPNITLAGSLPANGFFILERTDDDTLPEILADKIYKGALDNKGESLELNDDLENLIDLINCSAGWFAGNNKTKQTMERKNPNTAGPDPDNWQTSRDPGGTPKTKNSVVQESQLEQKVHPESDFSTYPSNIFINEILPSPEGPDATEEWIEIFNENGFEVDVSGWKIKDTTGRTETYIFPGGTKIETKGFLVLPRPTTKITLNNDGDGLKLLQPDGDAIDTVTYGKAPLSQSYNKTESGWVWSSNLTPGSPNLSSTSAPEFEKEAQKKEEVPETFQKKELAAISEQIPKEISFFPFLIALGIAVFSAVIILILKRIVIRSLHSENSLGDKSIDSDIG